MRLDLGNPFTGCKVPELIMITHSGAVGALGGPADRGRSGGATVSTGKGELFVGQDIIKRASCDSQVDELGKRNTSTIPPATRRLVLARDQHCCGAPGCKHSKFLEVHHIKSRSDGGGNHPENLITLCSSCHRHLHERGGGPPLRELEVGSARLEIAP